MSAQASTSTLPYQSVRLTSQCSDLSHMQEKYVNTINGIVGITLTEFEMQIVMVLLRKHNGGLTSQARKDIKDELKKSIANINNYIGFMREKGIFKYNEEDNIEYLNPIYTKPIQNGMELNVTFKVKL